MLDVRPSLDAPFSAFGVAAVVTPVGGGASIAATVIRQPPLSGALAIQAGAAVVDTHPRFSFRRDQVASLAPGSSFTIAEGPDAGAYRVDRIDSVDSQVLTVVAH